MVPLILSTAPTLAQAQWQIEPSGTTASLRGIHAVNDQIAWASGTNGTVLRTINGGQHWDKCTAPPDASNLDFRSVWAWDAQHAMAMSSGAGSQSRLYSTHDDSHSAAYTTDGNSWHSTVRAPAGYRSTVAWNESDGSWIAAGPTGSDISRDDGKTWKPMDRTGWNAISLPFSVGPDGRIGRLISWGQLATDYRIGPRHRPASQKD